MPNIRDNETKVIKNVLLESLLNIGKTKAIKLVSEKNNFTQPISEKSLKNKPRAIIRYNNVNNKIDFSSEIFTCNSRKIN
ncbi:hypothetical protein NUITMVS1_13840 [Shewanella xiamenensis]|nr:hypothetical protein NUITMVS1_13840 [Shewanella xiamenensis]